MGLEKREPRDHSGEEAGLLLAFIMLAAILAKFSVVGVQTIIGFEKSCPRIIFNHVYINGYVQLLHVYGYIHQSN
jgi:hypothetical protein